MLSIAERVAAVVAVDPIRASLDLAPSVPTVAYVQGIATDVPVRTSSVDVIWCCLVLGSLTDEELTAAAREIRRVLRPGAPLIVVDNTTDGVGGDHYRFRSAATYAEALGFARLAEIHSYLDFDERISLMVGYAPGRTP